MARIICLVYRAAYSAKVIIPFNHSIRPLNRRLVTKGSQVANRSTIILIEHIVFERIFTNIKA